MTRAASLLFLLAVLGLARPARAQLHWDAGAQVGVSKRFLSSRPAGGGDASFGPVGEIHGHIAVLPLLRVGPYVAHDISPLSGDAAAMQITSAGLRVKVTSPVPLDPLRIYGFVGLGYAGTYAPSFHTTLDVAGARQDTLVTGAGGNFFEVPFGIGLSYKIRRPWHFTAELSGRFGFGFTGSLYDPYRAAFTAGQPQLLVSTSGRDSFGIGLSVGVLLDM